MGTEIEGKAYIPGYFDKADSSVNSNGNMLPYYENRSNFHLSDKFTIVSATGSVHYDKEMVKRTMLVHEAKFRKQVYELHCLYQIQKDLMAQFQGEEFNGFPRYVDTLQSGSYASHALPGDVKGALRTGTPISGHDLKQSSTHLINETSSQHSVTVASLRCSIVRSGNKRLDLQLPAVDVYADDNDDVDFLEEKPLKHLPGTSGSVHDGNTNLKLENSESKQMGKSWTTDIQPKHNSAVVNVNFQALQGNTRETGKVSESSSICANREMRRINSFRQRKDDLNGSMPLLQHKWNDTNSSVGHYLSSDSSFNRLNVAPPLFNHALNYSWKSNNTNFLTKSQNGIPLGSTSNALHNHPFKISGEPQYWRPPPRQNYLKDLDLNDMPADITTTWQQGSENSMVDTSAFRDKEVNLMKSQVPSCCATQNFVRSTLVLEDKTLTRIPSFPICAVAEKDYRCSPALECEKNISTSIMHEADKKMQPKGKNADSSIKNLFDLNEALPVTDDPEMDICESEIDIAPHEPDDPSKDSLVTAAENLIALCNEGVQPGSPQLYTLHWFAELATSKENVMCGDDSDDEFEALTRKLEEIKSYEYHSIARTIDGDSNAGHCSATSLLVTRPRRGKVRGRPLKKKDFQKGILPSLASLPGQVVSEDLCLLGKSKSVTLAKRGGRNWQQPTGRRRSRSMAAVMVVEEAKVNPLPPPQLVPADLDADALGITRWGRTTRRCQRPRCRR